MKRRVIATLLEWSCPNAANAVAYASLVKRRKGSERDNADYPPAVVFDHDLDGEVELYWYDRDAEADGLYVNVDKGQWEWWWPGVDVKKAEKIANQVADMLADYYDGELDESDLAHDAKRLGAR